MSVKSHHSWTSEDKHSVKLALPQVDNSDFEVQQTADQVHSQVDVDVDAEPSLDRVSIFSFRSNSSEDVSPNVENVAQKEEFNTESKANRTEKPFGTSETPIQDQVSTVSPSSVLIDGENQTVNSAKLDNSNSLYDSNEKLVFSTASDLTEGEQKQSAFWKNLLLVSLSPYALVGVPTTGIYQQSQQRNQVVTGSEWLKFLFSTSLSKGINSIELGLVAIVNLYVVYLFVAPLIAVSNQGQLAERLIAVGAHFYEMVPLLIGLNLVWPKGYSVSNIVQVLDARIELTTKNESKVRLFGGLFKMVCTLLCVLYCTGASLVSFEWKWSYFYMLEMRSDFYYHLVARFFLMLVIPLYLTIISGLHRRIYLLNTYIRLLAQDVSTINLSDLQRVKDVFKQNADLVCTVNAVFNMPLSYILIVVFIYVLKDLFQVFMLVASLDSFSISLEKGSRQVDPELLSTATKWIVIDASVIVCRCMLLGLTVSKIKDVNKEIKQILSHLHDLASNYVKKPSEIYQSFSLVKYYVKTRNEESDKPAILRLSAVKWIPCLSLRK